MATLYVTNLYSSGVGSLSYTLGNATFGDTIVFDSSLNGTIDVTSTLSPTFGGVTIDGGNKITLDGQGTTQIFAFGTQTDTIENLRMINGSGSGSAGAGAILNGGNLTLINDTFDHDQGSEAGAVVNERFSNSATLIVTNCTFTNDTGGAAGAIANYGPISTNSPPEGIGNLTVTGSTFTNDSATGGDRYPVNTGTGHGHNGGNAAGAILNQGTAYVASSNFSNDTATGGKGQYGSPQSGAGGGAGGSAAGALFNDGGVFTFNNSNVTFGTGLSAVGGSGGPGGGAYGGGSGGAGGAPGESGSPGSGGPGPTPGGAGGSAGQPGMESFGGGGGGGGGIGFTKFNTSVSAVCYVRGTKIRTTRGEVPVEALQVGDRAVSASSETRPVTWLGHRLVDCRDRPEPRCAWPVRVSAHAFGENLPDRDLYLSPGHAVRVSVIEHALIPIEHLINGASIARVPVDEVEYWHVELDHHDVILANNLPAESYIDMNNRDFFVERGRRPYVPTEPVHPVIHHGALVDAVREQLCSRAQKLGWTEDKDPAPELEIDGTVHQPTAAGPLSVFIFPTTAKCVRLLSKSFVPGDIGSGSDPRTLGLSLQSLKLVGRSKVAEIPLDALDTPYPIESEVDRRWRWTDGALKLSPKLWTGFEEKTLALYVAYDAGALRGWTRPNVALHSNTSHSRLRLVDTAHQRRIRAV